MILNHLDYCSRLTQALERAIPTLSRSGDSGEAPWIDGALEQCRTLSAEIRETIAVMQEMRKLVSYGSGRSRIGLTPLGPGTVLTTSEQSG